MSLQGHFLVAVPDLPDPNFNRSVVLMLRHDHDGAFGLVLNRPTNSDVGNIAEKLETTAKQPEHPIFLGGPVGGPVIAIHTRADQSDGDVMPGLFFATRTELLAVLIREEGEYLRFFSGYSGWGPLQLEQELQDGSWLTTEATVDEVFADGEELWRSISQRIGWSILGKLTNQKDAPHSPEDN